MHVDGARDPLLYGRLDPAQLVTFDSSRWNAISLAVSDGATASISDRVDTVGTNAAIATLMQCERTLTR